MIFIVILSHFIYCITKDTSNVVVINKNNKPFTMRDGQYINGVKNVQIVNTTEIGEKAFAHNNLVIISIQEGAKKICKYAFIFCGNLESVYLPNSINEIEIKAFYFCFKLKYINIPNRIKTIAIGLFKHCRSLISIDIPESVYCIETDAFSDCESLKSVNNMKGLNIINNTAFFSCISLISISLPNITTIGNYTFEKCENLTSINFSDKLIKIGKFAFRNCSKLRSIIIPNGVERINYGTFLNCFDLSSVNFSIYLKIIEIDSFFGCHSISTLQLPPNLKTIEESVIELENIFKEDEVLKVKIKDEYRVKETHANEIIEAIRIDEGELNKRAIQYAKIESEQESLYNRLNSELNLTLAEAKEIALDVYDVNELKDEISNLKGKIAALGTVNLSAIVEYDEVCEKYEFMSSQELDLQKAKEELIGVIEEMTIQMQEVFKENFKILNENFGETFRELFKGGKAELILGGDDILNSNIIINVEPPGKKLQNINLMSGGEKVLSAIALLFAILKMKPTPFCILDEIEAALDDANVYRYAEFLKQFSENIQFIVITHRKGTMEASDVMYGITMEEKGISKVVSVDLSNN